MLDFNGDSDDDLCDEINASLIAHQKLKKQRIDDEEVIRKEVINFRPRKWEGRPPYDMSTWGRMLVNPRTKDPVDRKGGILFRRRFRVPFPLLERLVVTCLARHRPQCRNN